MTGTELAIKLGFIVSKDGRVFLNDKEYTSSTYNKKHYHLRLEIMVRNFKHILEKSKHIKNLETKRFQIPLITQMGIVLTYLMTI